MHKISAIALRSAIMFTITFSLLAPQLLGQSKSDLDILPTSIVEKTTVKLPATVDDIKIGGDGRFVLLHFKSLSKIGLFDVNAAEIVHYFPANDDDTIFDAGATKAVIASGSKGIIARYDLTTFERELTQTIDTEGTLSHLLIGSATEGPVYVGGGTRGYDGKAKQVDLNTLEATAIKMDGQNRRGFGPGGMVRISANGQTFGQWSTSGSPSGLQSLVKSGETWKGRYEHDSVGYILPSPDGRTLYTARGIYTNQLRIQGKLTQSRFPLPAIHGDYYLVVSGGDLHGRNSDSTTTVSLHLASENRPIVKIPGLEDVFSRDDQWSRNQLSIEKRLMFIPRANLIVQLSKTADSLVLHPFDLKRALDEAGIDYLVVQSRPPVQVAAGEALEYQLEILSKAGDVTYKLDSGPLGMKISKAGKVTWSPTKQSAPENNVIITVADGSGQEVFHNFKLTVPGGIGSTKQNTIVAQTPSELDSSDEEMQTVKLTEQSVTVKLPAAVSDVVHGGGGRYMLLQFESLKKIGLFDIQKSRLTHYFPATDDDTQMAAGLNHLLVASPNQGVISRYNLKSFERELTQAVPFTGKVQFMAMGANSMGPALMRVAVGTSALDGCSFEFLDLKTLDRMSAEWKQRPHSVYRDFNKIRASSLGGKFTIQGIGPVSLNGNKVDYSYSHDHRGLIVPSFDGSHYVGVSQIFNADMKLLGKKQLNNNRGGMIVPAVMGNYYLQYVGGDNFGSQRETKKLQAKLFMFGDDRPLVTIADVESPFAPSSNGYQQRLTPDKRVMFVPKANVIVTLADSNDKLVLRRMNIDEALEESGVDYLIVMSNGPATAKIGATYEYKMNVKTKKGDLKFKVESGPKGMTVSYDGQINWPVPKNPETDEQKIIVSVSDSAGQEVFHTFSIAIPELAQAKLAEAKRAAAEKAAREKERLAERQKTMRERERIQNADMETRMREKAKRQGEQAKQSLQPVKEATLPARFEIREWTDSSGEHTLRGKFMRIENKKTVFILNDKGKELKISLSKLSNEGIYEAVMSDLLRQGMSRPRNSSSPFKSVE